MQIQAFTCARCGAPADPAAERCAYCDAWLVRLTPFERRDVHERVEAVEGDPVPDAPVGFRSLQGLYATAIGVSALLFVLVYFVWFDGLSETELVRLAPLWFLAFHFGLSGLFTERALNAVLSGSARTFRDGLRHATRDSAPLVTAVVYLTFFPPFVLLGLRRLTSPLRLASLTTLAWAVLLYGFLILVFPSL
jgi:hypothetical protein